MPVSMSASETFAEAKKRRVELSSHDQDHKPSQKKIVELLAGTSNTTNTQDESNDDAAWNASPFLALIHASEGCALK